MYEAQSAEEERKKTSTALQKEARALQRAREACQQAEERFRELVAELKRLRKQR